MIAITDYGMGNLRSVQKALEYMGAEAEVTQDAKKLASASHVILPGVGAFGDAMKHIHAYGLQGVLHDVAVSGKPLLGICLGMQLFFEHSLEMGEHAGLGLLPGAIVPLRDAPKTPHMGWNDLAMQDGEMFRGIESPAFVYFVHSFSFADVKSAVAAAVTEFGSPFVSAVRHRNIWGMQYHPEKSGATGLKILKNFISYGGESC